MKKSVGLLCMFLVSCGTLFIPGAETGTFDTRENGGFSLTSLSKKEVQSKLGGEIYDLRDFESYVFEMCESAGHDLDNFDQTEILAFPRYKECNEENKKVVEKTYLYIPKDGDGPVFYVATLSHKYLARECGTFNCPEFEGKVFIEDLDFLYAGKMNTKDGTLLFYNKRQKGRSYFSKWEFDTLQGEDLVLKKATLTESRFDPKPQVALESVFSIPIVFQKRDLVTYYGKSLFNEECFNSCGISAPRQKKTALMDQPILFMSIGDKKIALVTVDDKGDFETHEFSKSRLKLNWQPY
ncbi:hypothetical protein [Ulvibacterium sp.]|uniref:hypothetical protein n=1 Tax=Ulvibacterium sp. TaxID=2665914 RepID=UPI00261C8B0E|nr:hypothetical protein [Ulvibacterium sp.]